MTVENGLGTDRIETDRQSMRDFGVLDANGCSAATAVLRLELQHEDSAIW